MTPYEAYHNRKPSFGHVRVFDCVAYSKAIGPHVKKFDDRSTKTIHFGTEPGTKGYWLYDLVKQKNIVSRDVDLANKKGGTRMNMTILHINMECFGFTGRIL